MLGSEQDGWKPFSRGVADLQQFLVIHRGHELRVIPDTLDDMESNSAYLNAEQSDLHGQLPSRMTFFQKDDAVLDPQADKYRVPAATLEEFAANTPPFVDPESSQPTEASFQESPPEPMKKS